MSEFVIKGDICYCDENKKIITKNSSYVVCKGNKCLGVFESLPDKYKDYILFDYSNKLVIPGLIDLHIHAPQYAFRGIGMDLELIDWLNEVAFKEEGKYSDIDYAKKAYSIFANNMKRSSTTRACIFATRHRKATMELMKLLEYTGLITYVGKINMDRNSPEILKEETFESSAYNTFGWINACLRRFKRTKPILTPRFIPSCSDELLNELREIQLAYKLPVQSHLSENPGEVDWVKEICPNSQFYGDAYDQYCLFGRDNDSNKTIKTVMAHCVYSSPEEIQRLKKNRVFVAHCPSSNTNLSSGIAPIRKYLDKKINVGLGSDVGAGHNESMFSVIRDTIQVSKLYWRLVNKKYQSISFDEAFYLATLGGGKFFGNVGTFEEGFEFDALVLDDSVLEHPQELTLHERLERAVYLSLDEKKLVAKFVAGKEINI